MSSPADRAPRSDEPTREERGTGIGLCRFGWHDWGRWSGRREAELARISIRGEETVIRIVQDRTCRRCGKNQWRFA